RAALGPDRSISSIATLSSLVASRFSQPAKARIASIVKPKARTGYIATLLLRLHFRMTPLAYSRHSTSADECPLSGVKRTSRLTGEMSAYDPKRTSDVRHPTSEKIDATRVGDLKPLYRHRGL